MTDSNDGLNDLQSAFLRQRAVQSSDKDAAVAVGCSVRSVARWKKHVIFREAYDTVVLQIVSPALLEDEGEDRKAFPQTVVQTQLSLYNTKLAKVFERLFDIALHSASAPASLRAITLIGDWYGIGPEQLTPANLTVIQQQIKQWTTVQVVQQDGQSNRDPGEAALEGAFTEVPSDE